MTEARKTYRWEFLFPVGAILLYLGNRFFAFHEWTSSSRYSEYGYYQLQLYCCLLVALLVSSLLFVFSKSGEVTVNVRQRWWVRGGRGLFLLIALPFIASWTAPLLAKLPLGIEETRGVYRYQPNNRTVPTATEVEAALLLRREDLQHLMQSLWQYASDHDSMFPSSIETSGFADQVWSPEGCFEINYEYQPGLRISDNESPQLLVVEPPIIEGERFVLWSDGAIELLSTAEIREHLKTGTSHEE